MVAYDVSALCTQSICNMCGLHILCASTGTFILSMCSVKGHFLRSVLIKIRPRLLPFSLIPPFYTSIFVLTAYFTNLHPTLLFDTILSYFLPTPPPPPLFPLLVLLLLLIIGFSLSPHKLRLYFAAFRDQSFWLWRAPTEHHHAVYDCEIDMVWQAHQYEDVHWSVIT